MTTLPWQQPLPKDEKTPCCFFCFGTKRLGLFTHTEMFPEFDGKPMAICRRCFKAITTGKHWEIFKKMLSEFRTGERRRRIMSN